MILTRYSAQKSTKYTGKKILAIAATLLACPTYSATVTPSDVYREVQYTIANLKEIRAKENATNPPRVVGVQIAKTPLHVYAKGLELYEKINRYQAANGQPAANTPSMPAQKTTPTEVFELMTDIRRQTEKIKQHLGINNNTNTIDLSPGKTPSDVYQRVWQASYLMDALVGAIEPKFVFENTKKITYALVGLANSLGRDIKVSSRETLSGKKPVDANIEGYKVLYQLVALERELGLTPLRVPSFPAGKIEPSDVYDTTNTILAELTRLRIHSPYQDTSVNIDTPTKVTPNDVVAQLHVIQDIINQVNF